MRRRRRRRRRRRGEEERRGEHRRGEEERGRRSVALKSKNRSHSFENNRTNIAHTWHTIVQTWPLPCGVFRTLKGLSKELFLRLLIPHPWGPAGKQTDVQIGAKHGQIKISEWCKTRNKTRSTCFQHVSFSFFPLLSTPTPCSKTYVLTTDGGSPKHHFQHSPGR